MDKNKFDAVFPIISAALVEKIAVELNLSDKDAVTVFCLESYKQSHNITGQDYIVEDIDVYINSRRN